MQVTASAAAMSAAPFDRRNPRVMTRDRVALSAFFSMTAPSSGPGPDRIRPVQIFKVTGPVGPFFGWTVRSLLLN